jgi:Kdo2-lipid IVA lauroyltransferase/acyltransferase
MIKIIKYFFEAFFVYLFFIFSKLVGLNLSRKIFSKVFIKIGPLIKRKEIINKNLNKFSAKLSEKSKRKLISDMWSNYGMTFVEYVFLKKLRQENFHMKIKGEKILDEIYSNDKSVIFISGHFANYELMAMEITKKKIKLATIYRPLNNFFLNPFIEYIRKKFICKNQIKKGRAGVKDSIKFINKKHSIALMIDQRVSEGDKIEFFNSEAYTSTLPAQLGLKYNLNIVPIHIERKNDDSFEMEVFEPLDVSKYKSKLEISIKLNQVLEKMIIRNPSQWIWTHDRWK